MYEIKEIKVGPWNTRVSEQPAFVPNAVVLALLNVLKDWQSTFTHEDTLAQREYGIPSLLVRFDCTPTEEGGVGIYEIEERPSGAGITGVVNPDFRRQLEDWRKNTLPFRVLVSPRRGIPGTDDFLWAPIVAPGDPYDGPLLIRAEPEETEFHHLALRSISSLRTKGDKSYGHKLGWWKDVGPEYVQYGIPWEEGFCLKPKQSSKCRGVHIFQPLVPDAKPRLKQVRSLLNRSRLYMQPWIPPGRTTCAGEELMVLWRIFFAYDIARKEWLPLGGHWIGRQTLPLHGAPDAVHAPLLLE